MSEMRTSTDGPTEYVAEVEREANYKKTLFCTRTKLFVAYRYIPLCIKSIILVHV